MEEYDSETETTHEGYVKELYRMNAPGTGRVNLTGHPADDSRPAW